MHEDLILLLRRYGRQLPICNGAADALEAAAHNQRVLTDALWKACGDDEQAVLATIESQGEIR